MAHLESSGPSVSSPSPQRSSARAIVKAGVAAGILGAVVKAAFMMFAAVVHEKPALMPLRPLGATLRGEDVGHLGAGSLLYGLALLLVLSAVLGVLFAALLPPDFEPAGAAMLGIGYALVVMSFLTSGVLPEVNPLMRGRMPALGGSWVIAAALFGVAMGAVPWLRRRAEGAVR